jgi:hypothetical protein
MRSYRILRETKFGP